MAIRTASSSSGILRPKDATRRVEVCKCFLQFTAVAIYMGFKLEKPHRALSSAKPCSVGTLVLLGLAWRSGGCLEEGFAPAPPVPAGAQD